MHLSLKLTAVATLAAISTLAVAQEQVVKIGHVGPVSGAIAHLGKDNEWGARLAIEELNAKGVSIGGKKVKFELVADDDAADDDAGERRRGRLGFLDLEPGHREPVAQRLQTKEMGAVKSTGRAERQSDPMNRNLVGFADDLELTRGKAIAHVVFGVNFEPQPHRRRGQSLFDMAGLEAQSGGGGHGRSPWQGAGALSEPWGSATPGRWAC